MSDNPAGTYYAHPPKHEPKKHVAIDMPFELWADLIQRAINDGATLQDTIIDILNDPFIRRSNHE